MKFLLILLSLTISVMGGRLNPDPDNECEDATPPLCKTVCSRAVTVKTLLEKLDSPFQIPVNIKNKEIKIENGRIADLKLDLDRITVGFKGVGVKLTEDDKVCENNDNGETGQLKITFICDVVDIYLRGYDLKGTILEDIEIDGKGDARNKLTNFTITSYIPYKINENSINVKYIILDLPKFDFSIDKSLVIFHGIAKDDVRIFLDEFLSGFSHELVEIVEYYLNKNKALTKMIIAYLTWNPNNGDGSSSEMDYSESEEEMNKGLEEIINGFINMLQEL